MPNPLMIPPPIPLVGGVPPPSVPPPHPACPPAKAKSTARQTMTTAARMPTRGKQTTFPSALHGAAGACPARATSDRDIHVRVPCPWLGEADVQRICGRGGVVAEVDHVRVDGRSGRNEVGQKRAE